MCRHIGYIGNEECLYNVLLNKKHSLSNMAFNPKEMKNAKLNADGFGIAWANKNLFFMYKSSLPIWNDINLIPVTKNLSSKLILANVRSATLPDNVSYNNTHPFKYKNFLFSHNGFIKNFNFSHKKKILKNIDSELLSSLKGNTDSEYIFFLFLHAYQKIKNISKAIYETIKILERICNQAMLNFLIAYQTKSKQEIYATKYAINLTPPSLYYFIDKKNNIFVSSEKLDNNNWISIQEHTLIKCVNKKIITSSLL